MIVWYLFENSGKLYDRKIQAIEQISAHLIRKYKTRYKTTKIQKRRERKKKNVPFQNKDNKKKYNDTKLRSAK